MSVWRYIYIAILSIVCLYCKLDVTAYMSFPVTFICYNQNIVWGYKMHVCRQHVKCTCYSCNVKVLFRVLLVNCCNLWLFSGLLFLNISQCLGAAPPSATPRPPLRGSPTRFTYGPPLTKNTLLHLWLSIRARVIVPL